MSFMRTTDVALLGRLNHKPRVDSDSYYYCTAGDKATMVGPLPFTHEEDNIREAAEQFRVLHGVQPESVVRS